MFEKQNFIAGKPITHMFVVGKVIELEVALRY
jgi:hypothetical protein